MNALILTLLLIGLPIQHQSYTPIQATAQILNWNLEQAQWQLVMRKPLDSIIKIRPYYIDTPEHSKLPYIINDSDIIHSKIPYNPNGTDAIKTHKLPYYIR